MNINSTTSKIGFLVSTKYPETISKHSRGLIQSLNVDSQVIFIEEDAEVLPKFLINKNTIRSYDVESDDFNPLLKALTENNIKQLYVNLFEPFFANEQFINFLNICNLSGVNVVAEIVDASIINENITIILERFDSVIVNDSSLLSMQTLGSKRFVTETTKAEKVETIKPLVFKQSNKRSPRILMQSRANAYTQPGGDTVVMDRVSEGLRKRGLTVDIDTSGEKNPRDYDLVNLFNFALKDHTAALAKNCIAQDTKYSVITMYEDWPIFYNQMTAYTTGLVEYIKSNQDKNVWEEMVRKAKLTEPLPFWDNTFTADNSSCLIATGQYEADSLKRDYPNCPKVEIYHCGGEIDDNDSDNGELFYKETGLKDFVFCVGRFELRKNQLMLLKALESSDLTVVFAGGGFSYQPMYIEACKLFNRKGKTILLDRLDPKMLRSAFKAARLHVLPSWFELPGIVSIEAARLGKNIVVSDYGTARDYFEDYAFYCKPGDPESIHNAVVAAYYSDVKPELKKNVEKFTWDNSAKRVGEIFKEVLKDRENLDWGNLETEKIATYAQEKTIAHGIQSINTSNVEAKKVVERIPLVVGEFQESENLEVAAFCDQADSYIKEGNHEEGVKYFNQALAKDGNCERAYRGLAIVAIEDKNFELARNYIEHAVEINSEDNKTIITYAYILWEQGQREKAFGLYLKAANQTVEELTAVYYLINAAYQLNKLLPLEKTLYRVNCKTKFQNTNLLFCLAGCLYKRGRYLLAKMIANGLLKLDGNCSDAKMLLEKISEVQSTAVAKQSGFDIEKFSEEIKRDKKAKRYKKATAKVEAALKDVKLSAEDENLLRIIKAELAASQGDIELARLNYNECKKDSNYFRLLAGRAALLAAESQWQNAEALFKQSLALNPNYDVAFAGLALCSANDQQLETAWEFYNKALTENPTNKTAIYGVVDLGYKLERLRMTAVALDNYLNYNPGDVPLSYTFAGCKYALGEKRSALAVVEKILEKNPEYQYAVELKNKINSEMRAE